MTSTEACKLADELIFAADRAKRLAARPVTPEFPGLRPGGAEKVPPFASNGASGNNFAIGGVR